ncbi:recombinase family protein, partial [Escherichia coli]|nr:recombinase family protein [Escherichia coli]
PDGRKAKTPLAEGASPASGSDRLGPTAVYNSVGKIQANKILAPKWQVSTVRKWLRSPTVYGQYQPHIRVDGKKVPEGDPIDNFYPAAVDRETFLKVQSI